MKAGMRRGQATRDPTVVEEEEGEESDKLSYDGLNESDEPSRDDIEGGSCALLSILNTDF